MWNSEQRLKAFRIIEILSVNHKTGFPERSYQLQGKTRYFGWINMKSFEFKEEAEKALAAWERTSK